MRAHRIGIVGCKTADARTLQLELVRHGYLADALEANADIVAYARAVRPLAVVMNVGCDSAATLNIIPVLIRDAAAPLVVVVGPGSDPACQIESLTLGANDFIPQPLRPDELLARLNILLGHGGAETGAGTVLDQIHQVLTVTENEIFHALRTAQPETLSREQIMWEARRQRISPEDRALDVYISHIRKKLKLIRADLAIETVRGKGFRLVERPAATLTRRAG